MKALLFSTNGITTKEHLVAQFEYKNNGDQLILCNGSLISGFETSCDLILMDCKNPRIDSWAESAGIPIEDFNKETVVGPEKNTEDNSNQSVTNTTVNVSGIDNEDVDSLVQAQIAKATNEAQTEETPDAPLTHAVPELKDVAVGTYTDPEGNVFERKKGPKLKGDLKAAIEKFGFEALSFKE